MPKSPATKQAREWLATGQAPADRSMEVALALALLSGEVPLSPAVLAGRDIGADVLMSALLDAEARAMWSLVAFLRDQTTDRACVKQARKILFRARQKGLYEEAAEQPRTGVDLSARDEAPPSYCTSFDRTGTQVVLHGGCSSEHGAHSLVGIVSQARGLESVTLISRPSRTRQRTLADDLARRFDGVVVEVPAPFAAGRLRWGLSRATDLDALIDGDAATARRLLSDVQPVAEVDTALDPDDEARLVDLAASSDTLVGQRFFDGWLSAERRRLGDSVDHDPRLVGDGDEPATHDRDRLMREAIGEHFPAEVRVDLAVRMEITAFLLAKDGKRPLALTSIATARLLRDGAHHPADIPFLRASLEQADAALPYF